MKNLVKALYISTLCSLMSSSFLMASDHIDGPVTSKHAITDLSDFYAFPTPDKADSLTLIANVHPFAREGNHFSDRVEYSFILRPSTTDLANRTIQTLDDQTKIITCSFNTPHNHRAHTMDCKVEGSLMSSYSVFNSTEQNSNDSFRSYHGLRADAFFFNAGWIKNALDTGTIGAPNSSDIMNKTNVLSVIVEISLIDLFGFNPGLLALEVESRETDGGKLLDRIGRPEVTNVLLSSRDNGPDLRDQFNADSISNISFDHAEMYRSVILNNISLFDQADQKSHWASQEEQIDFANLIIKDYLLIDMSVIGTDIIKSEYFSIEESILAGEEHTQVGGRIFMDDIMDLVFTKLVNNNSGVRIRDGVDQPSSFTSNEFPYLDEPDTSIAGWLKVKALRLVAGSTPFPR